MKPYWFKKGIHYSLNTEFKKGLIPWNKGKPWSKEVKEKISDARKGKGHPSSKKGKKGLYYHTEETKKKISKINKGRKLSEETKRKMSISRKGRKIHEQWRKNMSLAQTGKRHTEKTKRKISESHKGEKSYLWKGGITEVNKTIRQSIEMKIWRNAIFARDGYVCQKCQIKGGKLHPHHIQNFAQYLELRFAIDNGITLCKECHDKFHILYGRKNNTEKQIKEFLSVI